MPIRLSPLASLVFSSLSFSLMNPWLYSYHPAAPILVLAVMGVSGAAAALLIAYCLKRFPVFGFFPAAAAWVTMEYLRNSGFTAFPYGILGTSQYLNPCLLQSASAWGVWGISFALAAISGYLAGLLHSLSKAGGMKSLLSPARLKPFACILAIMVVSHVAGYLFSAGKPAAGRPGGETRITILAIQPNNEPRRAGFFPASWYADRIGKLIAEGVAAHPECDLVISSETAFPPSIELRMESSSDDDDTLAVRSFMRGLESIGKPIILGNDRGRFGLTASGERDRLHYNAALLIDSGRVKAAYEKNRLVPFIEYFPFYRAFPGVYRFLEGENGVLWTPGSRISVLSAAGVRIGTPICYEDCFGAICRDFARSGAELLAPISSDAWSGSEIAMRQHLANSVFRAVETRRDLVRVSNNGISCHVSASGKIDSAFPAFSQQTAVFNFEPRAVRPTPYFLLGDWFPILCALGLVALAALERFRFLSRQTAAPREK
jgi:apolipoprotein N-acyltransferase